MRGVTRAMIVAGAKKAAGKVKGPVTLRALARHAGISFTQVYYHYPEGFGAVLRDAGLASRVSRRAPVSRRELMDNLHRVVGKVGRLPTWAELRLFGKISNAVYVDRCGQMDAVRAAYRKWCREERLVRPREQWEEEAERRERGARVKGHGPAEEPLTRGTVRRARRHRSAEEPMIGGTRRDGPRVQGGPLVFRGVANEPVNEMGVVHLFGMVCEELGYVVMRMGRGFPDCTALRRVEGKEGLWETVRVEFEFRSSGFVLHRHDPKACEVLVCWEHDWKGCPLEVVELRSVVGRLKAVGGRLGASGPRDPAKTVSRPIQASAEVA